MARLASLAMAVLVIALWVLVITRGHLPSHVLFLGQ
jgi:hypothetical protein